MNLYSEEFNLKEILENHEDRIQPPLVNCLWKNSKIKSNFGLISKSAYLGAINLSTSTL